MPGYKLFLVCSLNVYLYTSCVYGSIKKGVAVWPGGLLCDDFKVLNNMSWWYDWSTDFWRYQRIISLECPASAHHLPEFVPMVWKYKWGGPVHTNISSDAQFVLGPNEPDRAKHADMTPQSVANIWPEIENHSHGKPIVSPVTASHDFQWYDDFFRACNGCRVDYVAAHAFSCDANQVMSYLEQLYHRYNKKIWLTEFACPHSTDEQQQLQFMKTLLPQLEAANYVFRYAWFSARRLHTDTIVNSLASLLHSNSSTLTTIGHFYNNFQGNGHDPNIVG